MSDVTQVLQAIGRGDGRASDELLPLVYDELRRLAAARMAQKGVGSGYCTIFSTDRDQSV